MFRFLFALCIGLGAGSYLGWTDHEKNEQHILARIQERAGSGAKAKIKASNDSIASALDDASNTKK